MAYDPGTGQLVLFGGDGGPSDLNDSWTWNGSTWTQLSPATSAPLRQDSSMAYDPGTGQLVLFGGYDQSNGAELNDTWTWNGGTWTQLTPATSPPARDSASMAYDRGTGQLVLFGGYDGVTGHFDDAWTWEGSTWTQLTPATSPPLRLGASMAYDTGTGQLVLFGGQSGGGMFNDTWIYQSSTIGTVGFNSDGGAAVSSLSGPDGSSITLPSDTYPGYTFDGWFTAASDGTEVGGTGSSYTIPSDGITLHAQWTAIPIPKVSTVRPNSGPT
jgi:uncharacterized repeat protein (TIGR02543 family)